LSLVLFAGLCFAADPAEGCWISIDEKTGKATAGWEIYVQGGKLYGKILAVADKPQDVIASACKSSYKNFPVPGDVSKMKAVGTPWIYGLSQKKAGEWNKGTVIDPGDGKDYGCEVTYHAADGKKYKTETLEMRGKIGPFGRSQFWQKATREAASAVR
jgi:uncharacterized protein (DUF2147 family)